MRRAEYWSLVLAGSVMGFVWGANQVALSIYLYNIGLNAAQIGIIQGISTAFMTAGSLAWGYLADLVDRKRLFYALSATSAALMASMASANPLAVAAAYAATSFLNRNVVYNAILGDYARARGISNEAFAASSSLSSLFAALGSSSASITSLGLSGFKTLFLLEGFVISLSAVLMAFTGPAPRAERAAFSLDIRRLKSYWLLKRLVPETLVGLGAGVIIPLFSLWFYLKFHVSMTNLSITYAISDVTLALGAMSAPFIAKVFGSRVNAIVTLQAIATVLLSLMPFAGSAKAAFALFIARTALMNMANPLISALINDLTPQEERGRVFGLWNTLSSVPRAAGPAIGGYLMNTGMVDAPLFMTAGLYAAAVVLFKLLLGPVEGRVEKS